MNVQENDAVLGVDDEEVDEEEGSHYIEDDSLGGSDEVDSSDSDTSNDDASEEYAWGDHVSSRSTFIYNDAESSDSDGNALEDEAGGMPTRRRSAIMRARRNILQFLRSD